MMVRNWCKSRSLLSFVLLLFSLAFIINIAWSAPLAPAQFTWGIIDGDGGSPYDLGVLDANNSTALIKGDVVQLIWTGPNGQINAPKYDGTVGGDDQLLTTSTIEKDPSNTLPPPLKNKGYIIPELFSYDSADAWEGGTVYVRAWNHPNAGGYNGATYYGNSATFILSNGGTKNLSTWNTNKSATEPEIQVSSGTELSDGVSTVDFGNTTIGSPIKKTFTIRNAGVNSLVISLPIGISNNGFSLATALSSTTINSQSEATFELQLDASSIGSYNSVITINNNDSNENPFTFTVTGEVAASEIDVSLNNTNIPDGSGPLNFGSTNAGTPVIKVFTVRNTGMGDLKISDLSVPTGFSIVQNLSSPTVISTNQTATFSIKMDAITAGTPSGTVQFTTNDVDENPFNFTVNGTVVGPDISVTESGVGVAHGNGTIVDYGATVTGNPVVKTFTVTNNGTGNLTLSNLTIPVGFAIVNNFSSTNVPPSGSATFKVRLNGNNVGSYSGLVSFNTNDSDANPFVFTVQGTVSNTAIPEIQVLTNNVNIPDDSGLVDFGATVVSTAVQKTFTVKNTGSANLTVSALNLPAGFSIVSGFGSGTVGAGQSTTFVVRLTANTAGDYEGTLSFTANDSDENPFNFVVRGTVKNNNAPEIVVEDGDVALTDGISLVDFGSTSTGNPVVKTLTVRNVGTSALTLSAPSLPNGFSVLTPFGSTNLAAGQSTTIQIQLNATTVKSYAGVISFANNDSDENPFTMAVEGLVTGAPTAEIVVLDGITNVMDNIGLVNFGSTVVGKPVIKTITIRNIGSAALELSDLTVPSGFTVLNSFDASIPPGNSTTFRVQLAATAVGSASGSISFKTNDTNENPFTFAVQGEVTATPTAEIAVYLGAMELSGATANYGSTTVGSAVVKTFTIKNMGSASLMLSEPIAVPAGYTVISSFANTTLVAGGSTTFRVRLNAAAPGNPAGNIQFGNNDSNENPFVIPVAGTVTVVSNPLPEIEVVANGVMVTNGTGMVDLGETVNGAPLFQTIFINNVGSAELTLSNLTVPAGYAVTNSFSHNPVAPGEVAVFQLRLNAGTSGLISGNVSFGTNDSDENPFTFLIKGQVVGIAASQIEVTTGGMMLNNGAALDFGKTAAGVSIRRIFFVRNTGTENLQLSGLSVPNGYSIVSSFNNTTVAPNGIAQFVVQLDAAVENSYAGSISFTTNDIDDNPFVINVTGKVIRSQVFFPLMTK